MRPTIRYENGKIHALYDEINLDESRKITEDDLKLFDQWIETYRIAIGKADSAEKLLDMGIKIYSWLNGTNGCMEKILDARVNMPLLVEFAVCARPGASDLSFLEVPWEILAEKNGFLAEDQFLVYSPVRRIGNRKDPAQPSEYRLAALFMAAEPRNGSSHLRYEEEESSLLDATGDVGMDLVVEESGNPGLLAQCLAREKNIDLLHISCHGLSRPKPLLNLEDEFGNAFQAYPKDLWKAVGSSKPRLLFLSACQTSEPGSLVNSFSSDMIQYGLPGVLGWGGSVTVLDQKVGDVTKQYIPEVRNEPGQLKFVLRRLIEKTLQDVTPILLVIDDFEQILKDPVDSSSLHCLLCFPYL